MARIELLITGEKESVGAQKVLSAASTMLKLLRAIEREQTGKRAKTKWVVDIQTGFRIVQIALHTESEDSEEQVLATMLEYNKRVSMAGDRS
jgi:hypothetical protein